MSSTLDRFLKIMIIFNVVHVCISLCIQYIEEIIKTIKDQIVASKMARTICDMAKMVAMIHE